MNKRTHRVAIGVFGGLMLVASNFGTVYGQSLSIGGNPAYPKADNPRSANIFILKLKPGETAKDGILISNPTKITRTVNLGAVDTIAAVDGSFSCKQNNEKRTGVGNWIALEKKQITLEAGESEVVNFTVTTPANVGPGEHGGCVTFQDTKSYAKTSGEGIQLGFRGAVRLAVTVPGEIRKELAITRVDTKRLEDGAYMVSPVAKNSGNVSLDVQARVQLRSFFGQKSRLLDDAKYPIMPGASMGWPYRFERPYWGGFYKAYASLSYNANPADGIGEHIVDTKKTSKVSQYFFMIPAPGAIAVYVTMLLLPFVALFWLLRRKRRVATLNKKWETYVVQAGDSLTGLASERGIRWKRLAKANDIKAPYGLLVGQQILLPKATGRTDKKRRRADADANSTAVAPEASAQPAPSVRNSGMQSTQQTVAPPSRDPRDIPWPSQEEEYRKWQAERQAYYDATPSQRQAGFSNPYHGDEDPAELAEKWNGPSQEAVEQHGIVEDASGVPPMHWMWDDLVDEPKKKTKKTTTKKTTKAKPKTAKKPTPKKRGK